MGKKIIVTGANGQLGSEIRLISANDSNSFVFIDIEDLDLTQGNEIRKYLEAQNPDFIINCAAYTAVDNAEEEVDLAFQINAEVPRIFVEFCNSSSCKLIHLSTDYVFSGKSFVPLKETDETNPESKYGKSKLKAEEYLANSPNALILRTSWLYSSFGKNFVKSMINLMKEREELKIVFDQIGSPTYAADLAGTILKIINSEDSKFVPGIYHYSNEGVASWYDFAFEIRELLNIECKLFPIETKDYPLPAPRPCYSVMNKEKIKNQFGLEIPHWKASLKICLNKINQL